MHVADSHNAIGRWEKRIHVNMNLLCICSGIALRNEEHHAHLAHCNDSYATIGGNSTFGAECTFSYTRQDVPLVGRQKEPSFHF